MCIKGKYGVITLNHKRNVMLLVQNKLTFYLLTVREYFTKVIVTNILGPYLAANTSGSIIITATIINMWAR